MLETRVAALEADMREVKGSLGRIEAALAKFDVRFEKVDAHSKEQKQRMVALERDVLKVDTRLQSVPTQWTLFMAILGTVFTVMGGTLAIVRFGVTN